MRVLFLGDVIGRPGRRAIELRLPDVVRAHDVDVVIANGENASGGKGLNPGTAEQMFRSGVDVITSGNHIWHSRDIIPYLRESNRVLRPLNYPPGSPGEGWTIFQGRRGSGPIAIVNLIGRVFMGPADCPFRAIDAVLDEIRRRSRVVVVDMHAEATSEKVGMGVFLDGRVSAVLGSHTHVQTADERILPGGTAHISDAGMCGPRDSILGMSARQVLERFLNQLPVRFDVATGDVSLEGALIDIDPVDGRARSIGRVREVVEIHG